MILNIPNLNKLIAHLEPQPPERINMGYDRVKPNDRGTCGCLMGHGLLFWPEVMEGPFTADLATLLGPSIQNGYSLTHPDDWEGGQNGVRRYPAHRVIATLKRLRRRGNSVALEPANARHEIRIFPADRVRVQGRLVGLLRQY